MESREPIKFPKRTRNHSRRSFLTTIPYVVLSAAALGFVVVRARNHPSTSSERDRRATQAPVPEPTVESVEARRQRLREGYTVTRRGFLNRTSTPVTVDTETARKNYVEGFTSIPTPSPSPQGEDPYRNSSRFFETPTP